MYQSSINIKHGCLTHLFWGVNRSTGEFIHIQEVEKNGLDCNCQCPVCKGAYIACIGEINRPHFKHQSKYNCMYTDEITTYLRTKQLFESTNSMVLPRLPVSFGQRTFSVDVFTAPVDNVFYHCEEEQYPPLLLVTIDHRPTRILLAFEGYYREADLSLFRNEANKNKWDCLVIKLPMIDADEFISTPHLCSIVLDASHNKVWLYSELETYWQQRLSECVVVPPQIVIDGAEAFDCPIHKQLYCNQYYATPSDCEGCQFNLGTAHDCRCSAQAGITCISDFETSEALRLSRVNQLRTENEQAIIARNKASEIVDQKKQQEAKRLEMGFYMNKTCPKCGKQLKERPGIKGIYWLCLVGQCGFHAFENHETGELIMHGME